MQDPLAAAHDFVTTHYPHAQIAFLGGSAATPAVSPTSDLDVFILLGRGYEEISYVETTIHRDWLVEAFVYGPAAAEKWLAQGRAERRPVLDRLAAHCLALTDNAETRRWAERAAQVLAAGPGEPDAGDVDRRRYGLSALMDDVAGASDPAESYVITATAWREAAELTLLTTGRWLGTGKWLLRELRTGPDHGLVAWAAGEREPGDLAKICGAVLDAAGGYLQQGYLRGERPKLA